MSASSAPPPAGPREAAQKKDLRKLGGGGGILLAATLAGNALLLLLDVWVNGRLGNEAYGYWCALRRMLAFAGFVGGLGMENAVIREVAAATGPAGLPRSRGAVRTAAALVTVASGVLVALSLALADPLDRAMDAPAGHLALWIGALTLPVAALRLVFVSASQGLGRISHRALVMFLAWPVAQAAGIAALLVLGVAPLLAVVGGYATSVGLGALLAAVLLHRARPDLPDPRQPGLAAPGPLLAFAWPLWVQGIVMAAYTWTDQILLETLGGPTQAGWYGPVAALAPLFGVGLTALNGMFAPMIAEKHAKGERESLLGLYQTVTRWAVALAIPPLLVALVAPGAVLAVWPNGSAEATLALRITCVAQLACTLVGSVNYLLIMAGFGRSTLWNGLPAVALNLGLCFVLVPRLGVTGAALANAAAMVTANGVGLLQVWRALRMHPFHAALTRPLIAALPTALVVAGVDAAGLPPLGTVLVAGLGGGAVFLFVLVRLGLDEGDRELIGSVARRFRR